MEELKSNYKREDIYDAERIEKLAYHYREILSLLGEDASREGLIKTPERVAKAMSFVTKGYTQDPVEIINQAIFREEYQQMVLVKEKINLFMKGQDTDLDEIYERFGIDYNLLSLLMRREKDEEGRFQIRWGEQKIA